jgi:hypothetical protein
MPLIKCKEKEGAADACKKEIVYLGKEVVTLFTNGGAAGGSENETKIRNLTLTCLDGHINNYQIKLEE